MAKSEFTIVSYLGRLAFAAILVFGTYNPTDYSYIGWVFAEETSFGPVIALVGVALLIGWVVFLRATWMSLGALGVILGTALFACLIWLLVDVGWLSLDSPSAISWVVLLLLSLVLATGMSWSTSAAASPARWTWTTWRTEAQPAPVRRRESNCCRISSNASAISSRTTLSRALRRRSLWVSTHMSEWWTTVAPGTRTMSGC